jgi:hypothetical protein
MKHIIVCHSGLSGISLCSQKDSRLPNPESVRDGIAGMTVFQVFSCNTLKET